MMCEFALPYWMTSKVVSDLNDIKKAERITLLP